MSTVNIDLDQRGYEIRIDSGLLSDENEFVRWIKGDQVFIVTNKIVAALYLDKVKQALRNFTCLEYILEDGEETKNLTNFSLLLDAMLSVPCNRQVTIVALGGGVIGDLAGYTAASYQRGVPFIQVPTTLLSQVDSSVGGKTGVNHIKGKNMIGAFYQPQRVLADIDTLSTLDDRQFSSGMAEVIKYGLIEDYDFFCWLEQNIDNVMARDPKALTHIISRSCEIKADIVNQDEREGGVRALLNLGHTFGHAIETATNYKEWLHGEAVAMGMAMAGYMSKLSGWLKKDDQTRIENLLQKARLPYAPFEGVTVEQMKLLMLRDKKVMKGTLRLILLSRIGQAVIVDDFEPSHLDSTLSQYCI